jgi:hypothetical protein
MKRKVREERRRKSERLEGEGESLVHRGRRIGMEMPAGVRSSDDQFRRPWFVLSGETKGEARATTQGTYRQGLDGHHCEKLPGGVTPAFPVEK